ncbi:N-acetylglutamate kinase [Neolewinella xylanilytica]|uniref:Acetylglutamate kinase n=1 Tax=Neolewinella xylanilytica TaxID=1514080 RepID=A0A2S6IBL7_9BACT|nr:acetylglutamate kinase [Neolewinella xylanilytica]PPK88900.1 N-acetylglutamate kinase [Neolewinella xylanilytica]
MVVVKIGGNVLNNPATLYEALDYFSGLVEPAVLVHGGGRRADEVLRAMGMAPKMTNGRRITDQASLEVVTMVYAGTINKDIVAQLQSRGTNAIGLSGADGNAVLATKRPAGDIDYGYAGDVVAVNAPLLDALLRLGLRPVLCPITHDRHGQLLNTNADTIANEAAKALAGAGHRVRLDYCFELPGVLQDINDPESVIPHLNRDTYAEYRATGVISDGMIPKLDNAFRAIDGGVDSVVIGNIAALRSGRGTRIQSS